MKFVKRLKTAVGKKVLFWAVLLLPFISHSTPVIRYIYDGYRDTNVLNPSNPFSVIDFIGGGNDPDHLRDRPGFPAGFTRSYPIPNLATPSVFSSFMSQNGENNQGEGEFLGSFAQGYIEAPMDGDYRFRVIGNDAANFYLSSDHSTNNLKLLITSYQTSEPVQLKRGRKYYFEILHVQTFDANYFQVAWTKPDGVFEQPILGKYLWGYAPNPTGPAVVVTKPSEGIVPENSPAFLTLDATSIQPAGAIWRKNGVPIPNETLGYTRVEKPMDGDVFDAVVTNAFGAVTSAPVRIVVTPDLTPPTVVRALAQGNPNGLVVRFSEPMSPEGLALASNYQLSGGVLIQKAEPLDGQNVKLVTSTLQINQVYQLKVLNVKDQAKVPNVIADNSTPLLLTHGSITKKVIFNVGGGGSVSLLKDDQRFQSDRPDTITFKQKFETPDFNYAYFGTQPDGYLPQPPVEARNYGTWFQGYLTPPTNGNYTFYLASSDEGELHLSRDETPAGKVLIAHQYPAYGRTPTTLINQTGAVGEWDFVTGNLPREYIKATGNPFSRIEPGSTNLPSNRSAPIALEAGKRYYVEALFKDGPGYPHLAVAWEKPGDPPTTDGGEPIGPEFLSAYGYELAPVKIRTNPSAVTVEELGDPSFQVVPAGSPPFYYQWLVNGEMVPGATNATVQFSDALRSNDQDIVSVQVRNEFSSIMSEPVRLTVRYDGNPPTLVNAESGPTLDQVTLTFSEPISGEGVGDLGNYLVDGLTVNQSFISGNGSRIVLSTSVQEPGRRYTVKVSNLKDLNPVPNYIVPESPISFTSWKLATGFLRADYFKEVPGEVVTDFIFSPQFPDFYDEVQHLSTPRLAPGTLDDFGVRITGYIVPKQSGSHKFFVRSRHASKVYLSMDELSANAQPLVEEPTCCQPFTESAPRSASVNLVAGRKHYIEVHFKAGEGEDYFELAWRQPGETTPLNQLKPISSEFLAVITDPTEIPATTFQLVVLRQGQDIEVSWPAEQLGFILEKTTTLGTGKNWQPVSGSAQVNSVRFPAGSAPAFFRLKAPEDRVR